MGKHSGALPLLITKVQTRIDGIKQRCTLCWKGKASHLSRGEMAGGYVMWWMVERGRMSELTQQKKNMGSSSSPPAVERCLDRPFEDPEILWSDKDICYKWGWWQFGFFGTICHSWLKCERKLNNSIWQFLVKKNNKQNCQSYALIWNCGKDSASVQSSLNNPGFIYCHLVVSPRCERQVEKTAGGCCHATFSCLTWE